ncbi:MAG: hypothetical protein ACYDEJ_14915 [Desulfitobacteriaceae bacterium]
MSTLALNSGGMVLPANYVEIDRDEMTYIEGGGFGINVVPVRLAGAIFTTLIGSIIGGVGVGSIAAYVARVGAAQAARIFTRSLATKLAAIGCASLAVSLGPIVQTALNYLDFGTFVAKKLDSKDCRPNNGWLTI